MEKSSLNSEETADHSRDLDYVITKRKIDKINHRYPFCIVWTPLPLISWFIPIIGHTGICTSDGIIHDFAGSYFIGVDDMAFGEPHKYVFLNPDIREEENWDKGVKISDNRFKQEEHNIFCNNCHSHVAQVLNSLNYKGKKNYSMIDIWWFCLIRSNYVSWGHIFKTYIGFIIIFFLYLLVIGYFNK